MSLPKPSVGGNFLTADDVRTGDLVRITRPPTVAKGTYREQQATLEVELADGGKKEWNINGTTYQALFDGFGSDGALWVGKTVKVTVRAQNVRGKMHDVLYGEPGGAFRRSVQKPVEELAPEETDEATATTAPAESTKTVNIWKCPKCAYTALTQDKVLRHYNEVHPTTTTTKR